MLWLKLFNQHLQLNIIVFDILDLLYHWFHFCIKTRLHRFDVIILILDASIILKDDIILLFCQWHDMCPPLFYTVAKSRKMNYDYLRGGRDRTMYWWPCSLFGNRVDHSLRHLLCSIFDWPSILRTYIICKELLFNIVLWRETRRRVFIWISP